ncbi:alkaline phosphatase family protein [Flavobacteriaceae bacterium]|nr:alkaline phosphatase family protein [Flavobacteriaceae bacterium]MDB9712416.1 alkaline phosphatase family protein [Flavobacteriaceae bacterium]
MKQISKYTLVLVIILSFTNCNLNSTVLTTNSDNPKLVVAIVVDQMRFDFLDKFKNKYSSNGFNRLIREGFNLKNNHYNYVPTVTGPGHASVATGSTPKTHGIAGNNWFDKEKQKYIYCTTDLNYENLGGNAYSAKMSPKNLLVNTFGDFNRVENDMKSKTISIAIKDRGSILMGGKKANAAYWFYGKDDGEWVSSKYYMDELPDWVNSFNNSDFASTYIREWNTLYDIDSYKESRSDNNNFEKSFKGDPSVSFPYDLNKLKDLNDGYDMLKETPFGNNLTTDFALEAISNEKLGKDDFTDVLTISYSSTDYIGHNFGVDAKETQDAYLRLDLEIERLLLFLDSYVGKNEYTLFLTADHGASKIPAYLNSIGVKSQNIEENVIKNSLKDLLFKTYDSDKLISKIVNSQVYLNDRVIDSLNLNSKSVEKTIISFLSNIEFIDKVYTSKEIINGNFDSGYDLLIQNGYNIQRSGDIIFKLKENIISYGNKGTTHGSGYSYDTHVPLIFFGKKIAQGESDIKTKITDIAPTIVKLLGLNKMIDSTGEVLEFVIKD